MNTFEIIGWIGFALFIISYFLLSIAKLRADKPPYHLMNILGGLCLVISAYDTNSWPNFYTNLIWMVIGIYAILLILVRRKNE